MQLLHHSAHGWPSSWEQVPTLLNQFLKASIGMIWE
jgi:hypothetical protein